MMKLLRPLAALALACTLPIIAQAADDESDETDDGGGDDDISDILKGEESASEEKRAVKEGDVDDRVGVKSEDLLKGEEAAGKRRLIKTLQRKNFLKIGRFEVGPHLGFVTNDPFINRYLVGVNASYHLTEVFAVEVTGTFSPDFGEGDWKPITHQLVDNNKVSPDISKIVWTTTANFEFSPIYGKIAVVGRKIINFDIFGAFGMGIVNTNDDLKALQKEGVDHAEATKTQTHLTTNIGGGLRVIFSKNFAARVEGRSVIYIETIDSTTLEYKNNFMVLAGASFFFPGMK